MEYKALVVEDDDETAYGLCVTLKLCGFKPRHAKSAEQALQRYLREETFHLAVCDWKLPQDHGLNLIQQLHESCPATYTVMLTGYGRTGLVTSAFKRGAVEYFDKPLLLPQMKRLCQRVTDSVPIFLPNKLLAEPRGWVEFEGLLSREESMLTVFDGVRDAAPLRRVAFLVGEFGVGLASLARALHNRSSVAEGPFVRFRTDCHPPRRLERLLFGCERDAVDEADPASPSPEMQRGAIEQAGGGTLFIDNVAGLDSHIQAQLLEFIELGSYRRVGSSSDRYANVRIIAGQTETAEKPSSSLGIHVELEYLLRGCLIRVPALRERRRDIPLLANQLLRQLHASGDCKMQSMSLATEQQLLSYDWPGNLPELESVMKLATFGVRSAILHVNHLPKHISGLVPLPEMLTLPLGSKLEYIEREAILRTLRMNHNNKSLTAEALGISRRSLQSKLQQHEEHQTSLGPDTPDHPEGEGASAADAVVVKPKSQ